MGFTQEAGRPGGSVVDTLTDARLDHPDHGANQWTRGVVLAAVTPGVAHVLDFRFIQMRKLVLLGLGAKAQRIDQLQGIAQAIAAGELVADLAEDLANPVFQGLGIAGPLAEALQVRKQLAVDEGDQITSGERVIVVELAIGGFRCGPGRPAVGLVDHEAVGSAHQLRFLGALVLKVVQVFEKQHPRGLLGVVQLGGAAGLFPEHVVDITEGLFKHQMT